MSPWLIEFDSRCFNYSSPLKRETQPHLLLPTSSSTSSSSTTSSVSEPVCGSTELVVLFWPDAIVSIPRNRWSLLTLRLLFLRSLRLVFKQSVTWRKHQTKSSTRNACLRVFFQRKLLFIGLVCIKAGYCVCYLKAYALLLSGTFCLNSMPRIVTCQQSERCWDSFVGVIYDIFLFSLLVIFFPSLILNPFIFYSKEIHSGLRAAAAADFNYKASFYILIICLFTRSLK